MVVYVIRYEDKVWSFNKGWTEEGKTLPAIYPDLKAAQKALKGTKSRPSKQIFTAEFWGYDLDKIEIIPFSFEEVTDEH